MGHDSTPASTESGPLATAFVGFARLAAGDVDADAGRERDDGDPRTTTTAVTMRATTTNAAPAARRRCRRIRRARSDRRAAI
jgi:hypothetical protein